MFSMQTNRAVGERKRKGDGRLTRTLTVYGSRAGGLLHCRQWGQLRTLNRAIKLAFALASFAIRDLTVARLLFTRSQLISLLLRYRCNNYTVIGIMTISVDNHLRSVPRLGWKSIILTGIIAPCDGPGNKWKLLPTFMGAVSQLFNVPKKQLK